MHTLQKTQDGRIQTGDTTRHTHRKHMFSFTIIDRTKATSAWHCYCKNLMI